VCTHSRSSISACIAFAQPYSTSVEAANAEDLQPICTVRTMLKGGGSPEDQSYLISDSRVSGRMMGFVRLHASVIRLHSSLLASHEGTMGTKQVFLPASVLQRGRQLEFDVPCRGWFEVRSAATRVCLDAAKRKGRSN